MICIRLSIRHPGGGSIIVNKRDSVNCRCQVRPIRNTMILGNRENVLYELALDEQSRFESGLVD